MLYIGWSDFFTSRKEFGITMEYQNNNGNYDNRNRRKSKRKKGVITELYVSCSVYS